MASVQQSDTLSEFRHFMRCTICLETLTAPRTLPCLHTFCTSCLESHADHSVATSLGGEAHFPCPACRERVVLPPDGVRGFRRDFRVEQIREILNKNATTSSDQNANEPGCSICFGGFYTSSTYCRDCRKSFCDTCAHVHNQIPVFRGHVVEVGESGKTDSSSECEIHSPERLAYLCEDCCQLVCSTCVMRHHGDHVVVEKERGMKELKRRVDFQCKTVLTRRDQMSSALDSVRDHKRQLDETRTSLMTQIKAKVTEVIEDIYKQENELIQELEGHLSEEDTRLDSVMAHIETLVDKMSTTTAGINDVIERDGERRDVIRSYRDLERDLTQLVEESILVDLSSTTIQLRFTPAVTRSKLGRLSVKVADRVFHSARDESTSGSSSDPETNDSGVTSCRGSPGVNSYRGSPGVNSYQGSPGVNSYQGSPGVNSYQGSPGVNSYQGSPGVNSYQGSPGVNSYQGSPGVNSYQGSPGVNSYQGSPGVNSYEGSPGVNSYQGSPGVNSYQGSPGVNSYQGSPGVSSWQRSSSAASWQGSPDLNNWERYPAITRRRRSLGVTSCEEAAGVSSCRGSRCDVTISLTIKLGSRGAGGGQFDLPRDVSCLREGRHFVVCDTNNERLQVFDEKGLLVRVIGQGDVRPWGVTASASGDLVVADNADKCVKFYDVEGRFLRKFGSFLCPCGVAVTSNDHVIVTDFFSSCYYVMDDAGDLRKQVRYRTDDDNHGCGASRVAVTSRDDVIISDVSNASLKAYDRHGRHLWTVADHVQLIAPHGVCVTSDDVILVGDCVTHRIAQFNIEGEFLGTIRTHGGRIKEPTSLAISKENTLVVGRMNANQIRVYRVKR